jgi:hypothetical protein
MAISRPGYCAFSFQRHPNAIHSRLGNAEMAGRAHAGDISRTGKRPDFPAAHNQSSGNFILLEEFQIALPLNWIGIILRGT